MVTGSCLCKNLTYEITLEDDKIQPGICHCRSCQRLSGAVFSVNLIVPATTFKLQGTPKTFSRKGDSGKNLTINFCDNCGHHLFVTAELYPGVVIVKAGTVDDADGGAGWIKDKARAPVREIYCKDKMEWLPQMAEVALDKS